MRISDVLRMAVHNLWHRRMRSLLNLNGIVIGCIVLLMTASGASGVRSAIQTLFDSADFVRQIHVFPNGGIREEPPESEIVVDAEVSDALRNRQPVARLARGTTRSGRCHAADLRSSCPIAVEVLRCPAAKV